ncbi:uncharacterized protein LOC108151552 [Drosophila miranda]|uniref:uncharacterized protein LOC108151552 n=1 Tax=Drosophila miranda TaxID=7229 RepID=UPI0007E7CD85|nr:uncharacterized protein LOC108151552 [Drosophila miranda]
MPVEDIFPYLPQDVVDYLLDQKNQERQLNEGKKKLKEGMLKIEDQLKLLDGRQDDQICTISWGNIYQKSTVNNVRHALVGRLSKSMDAYLKANRKLLRLHRQMYKDTAIVYHKWGNTSSVPRLGNEEV